jgi:hypothetical protein
MHPEKTAQTTPVHVFDKAKQRVETAYAHAPLMLAHDRRVLDVPLEERLQSRTSELLAWAKTIPVINRSVRDARHYKLVIKTSAVTSPATVVVTTGDTAATPPVPSTARPEAATPPVPSPARPEAAPPLSRVSLPILDRRRLSARTRIATLYDIRQYFPGIADSAT